MKRDQKLYTRFGTDFIFSNKCTIVIDFLINQCSLSYQFSYINSPTSIFLHQLSHINSLTFFPYAFWFGFCFFEVYGARYKLDTKSLDKLIYLSSPSQKPHLLMIQIYIRYPFYGQIHQELIPDTGLISNLWVSSFVSHLPQQNLICW